MILNCLEREFLKGFLVQGWQQSLWKFPILSNILDFKWWLPNRWKIHSFMFTCWGSKGGQVSKMSYEPPGAVYITSYKEPLDQSDCWKLYVQLWNYTKWRICRISRNVTLAVKYVTKCNTGVMSSDLVIITWGVLSSYLRKWKPLVLFRCEAFDVLLCWVERCRIKSSWWVLKT